MMRWPLPPARFMAVDLGIPIVESWYAPIGAVLSTRGGDLPATIVIHPFDRVALEHPRDPVARSKAIAALLTARVSTELDMLANKITARVLADLSFPPSRPGAIDRD